MGKKYTLRQKTKNFEQLVLGRSNPNIITNYQLENDLPIQIQTVSGYMFSQT